MTLDALHIVLLLIALAAAAAVVFAVAVKLVAAVAGSAHLVRASRWANRHEASFSDEAFAELKAEIAAAGVNVQPVSVRPVLNGSTAGGPAYELVFGHRRHRACLELGLPLQAMVTEMGDRELFEAMERENAITSQYI
mgnify:CR=1 FL=1